MQGFKKSLVALLAVAMVFSLVGTAFAAVPADVKGTQYEDAAIRLIALGVFKGDDKGNFNPEDAITRAEAVAIVIRALGLEKSADLMKGVTKFADVNADAGLQWATGAINIAVSSGIVNGYPDGNFGGRDNVTYAQLAKMILYALNYGVTVEGGVWPTAVLAKADELGVLDGLTVVADAPINRGFAAEMLDNSLDIKSLKQTGYGDLKQYEETGATLLEKMGFDEIEGRVVEIPALDGSKLDDDEIVIDVEVGKNEIDPTTYNVLESIDGAALFGLKVKAWVNDDDEIVFVNVKTAEKDIIYDTIKDYDKDEVKLSVIDKKYEVARNADVYVNFDKGDLAKEQYGRFVLDKGDVVFAHVFKFDTSGAVVTEVKDEVLTYNLNTTKDRKLRLDRADSYVVYDAEFNEVGLDAVKEGSVLYWYRVDDDYRLVVVNDVVSGKATRIKGDKLTVDGKAYTVAGTFSLDEDDKIEAWDAEEATDLVGEEVVAFLNLEGKIQHVRTDADATSGELYGVVLDHWRGGDGAYVLRLFNADGKKVNYSFEKKKVWDEFDDNNSDKEGLAVAFKLNSDGEIKEIELAKLGNVSTEDKKSYVEIDNDRYHFDSDTVLVQIKDGIDVDPALIEYEDLKKADLTDKQAYFVGEAGRTLKFLAFVDDVELVVSDELYGVVIDDPYYDGDDWIVEVQVAGEDEIMKYVVDGRNAVSKGDLITFKVKSGNELEVVGEAQGINADDLEIFEVVDKDGRHIKLDGWKTILRDAVVYEAKLDDGKFKLGNETDYSAIDKGDYVSIVGDDGDDEISALILYRKEDVKEKDLDEGKDIVTDGKVTYIDTGDRYVDFADGSTLELTSSFASALESAFANDGKELEDLVVLFRTNNAGDAIGLEVVNLGEDATVDETFFRELLAIGDITVAGEGTTKTKVTLTGDLDVDQDDVTITKLNIDADGNDITISGKNFTSKTNLLEGDVTVTATADNATFNTEITGTLTILGKKATLSNVEIGGNLIVNEDVTVSGSTTVAGTITVAPGVVIDASEATGEDFKEAAELAVARAAVEDAEPNRDNIDKVSLAIKLVNALKESNDKNDLLDDINELVKDLFIVGEIRSTQDFKIFIPNEELGKGFFTYWTFKEEWDGVELESLSLEWIKGDNSVTAAYPSDNVEEYIISSGGDQGIAGVYENDGLGVAVPFNVGDQADELKLTIVYDGETFVYIQRVDGQN